MRFISVLLLCISIKATACDICGCFMGITPYDNQSSIGLMHRYRVFNGYRTYQQKSSFFPTGAYKEMHGGTSAAPLVYQHPYSSKDFESYKVYELRVKYFIHRRIELNAIVPVNSNKSKEDTAFISHTGLGDPTFFAGYHLIRKVDYEKFLHRLILGTGVKIPSGNYYAKDNENNRIPLLLQPGTGSTDVFLYSNYVFGYRQFGFSINSMYKYNGTNYYHEQVGNSTSNYLNIFYKIRKGNFVFIPSAQFYYEYNKGIYINCSLQPETGMNVMLAGPGFDMYYKNISLNTSVQFRAFEKTGADNLKSAGRIVVGVSYNFKQNKYLLGKRPEE